MYNIDESVLFDKNLKEKDLGKTMLHPNYFNE